MSLPDNMPRLSRAIAIAAQGHTEQPSKDGFPYIMHPLTAMFRLRRHGESAMIVAVLHDFKEDVDNWQDYDLSFLTPEEAYALDCLTKRKGAGESYADYMDRVMTSTLAMMVKEQDLIHNLDGSRMPSRPITDADCKRWDKYRMALDRIRHALGRVPAVSTTNA